MEGLKEFQQCLLDTKSLVTLLDECFYKKKYDELDEYKDLVERDKEFRVCRELLKESIQQTSNQFAVNRNLKLALLAHVQIVAELMQNIGGTEQQAEVEYVESPNGEVKKESEYKDEEAQQDLDEIKEALKEDKGTQYDLNDVKNSEDE